MNRNRWLPSQGSWHDEVVTEEFQKTAPLRPVYALGTSPQRGGTGCRGGWISWFAITIMIAFLLCGCVKTHVYSANPTGFLAGVDVGPAVALEGCDSHGGFHGDGASYQKLQFPAEPAFPEVWQDMPMSEDFHTLIYGGNRDGVTYSGLLDFLEVEIPDLTAGKWYFFDRHSECTDPYDVDAAFGRSSWNYTAALWDSENLVLYYLEFDT